MNELKRLFEEFKDKLLDLKDMVISNTSVSDKKLDKIKEIFSEWKVIQNILLTIWILFFVYFYFNVSTIIQENHVKEEHFKENINLLTQNIEKLKANKKVVLYNIDKIPEKYTKNQILWYLYQQIQNVKKQNDEKNMKIWKISFNWSNVIIEVINIKKYKTLDNILFNFKKTKHNIKIKTLNVNAYNNVVDWKVQGIFYKLKVLIF